MKKQFVLVCAAIFLAGILPLAAQTPQNPAGKSDALQTPDKAPPSFEVVSIKENRSDNELNFIGFQPGKFVAKAASAKEVIELAYGIKSDDQISGAPSWVNSERFDIEAKEEDSFASELRTLPPDQRIGRIRPLVQSLLAERFQLQIGHDTKELPAYVLVLAKNGSKLTPSAPPPSSPDGAPAPRSFSGIGMQGRGKLSGRSATTTLLADVLSREPELGGRVVFDETGLTSKYDFTLQWTPEFAAPSGPSESASAPPTDSSGPSLFAALQEQLGLKLDAQKRPVPILVIQRIEKPSEN